MGGVEVSGAPKAVEKLKEWLKKDGSTPEVYDAEVAAVLRAFARSASAALRKIIRAAAKDTHCEGFCVR